VGFERGWEARLDTEYVIFIDMRLERREVNPFPRCMTNDQARLRGLLSRDQTWRSKVD
jgi:hypothetical protein